MGGMGVPDIVIWRQRIYSGGDKRQIGASPGAAIGLKEGDTIALMLRNEPALMDVMLAARQLD
jgi:hypothetical protein